MEIYKNRKALGRKLMKSDDPVSRAMRTWVAGNNYSHYKGVISVKTIAGDPYKENARLGIFLKNLPILYEDRDGYIRCVNWRRVDNIFNRTTLKYYTEFSYAIGKYNNRLQEMYGVTASANIYAKENPGDATRYLVLVGTSVYIGAVTVMNVIYGDINRKLGKDPGTEDSDGNLLPRWFDRMENFGPGGINIARFAREYIHVIDHIMMPPGIIDEVFT